MDSLLFSVTSQMDRAARLWRRLAQPVVASHGISEACALPLITIARKGEGLRQGALAEELGMEGPSLVRLLDQLCAAGLAERCDDPADRRAKTLRLTKKGRAVTEEIETDLVRLRREVLGGFALRDLEAMLRLYAVLEEAGAKNAGERRPQSAAAAE